MEVKLEHYTPLWVCSTAIRTCWDSHDKSDTEFIKGMHHYLQNIEAGQADKDLIDRIGNKMKHTSVKNHINYNFSIKGITTKTLLALTRHDVGTEFSVQSTRYTTKKSVNNNSAGYTLSKSDLVNEKLAILHKMIKECVDAGASNDEISLLLPQAWNYNLMATFSLGALQHFLTLRLKSDAHWDIRDLAHKLYKAIPEEHKYIFEDTKPND